MDKNTRHNQLNIISFTDAGSKYNRMLCTTLLQAGVECEGYARESFAEKYQLTCMGFDLSQYVGRHWGQIDFLFIGAVGIAVRMIAPFVKDKFTDSAVLSMDERGQYVIPILSGHMGGAVELAEMIAQMTKAIPVITTATDINHKFAVDVFAKKNHLILTDRVAAKKISAAVLDGNEVTMEEDDNKVTVIVSSKEHTKLDLLKKNLVVGIGCKKDTPYEVLEQNLKTVLYAHNLQMGQILSFASIDLKKEEAGLLSLASKYQIPFETFPPEELNQITNVSSESEFVKRVTGVDNVCERAAWLAADKGELVQPKICMEGTTFAIVRKEIQIEWK